MINQVDNTVAYLVEIMRWNVCCHSYRDTGGTIEQQIGQTGWQYRRLSGLIVIIGNEIYRVLVDVTQQFVCNRGHLCFGIAHRCRWIVILRTEIALPQYQWIAH